MVRLSEMIAEGFVPVCPGSCSKFNCSYLFFLFNLIHAMPKTKKTSLTITSKQGKSVENKREPIKSRNLLVRVKNLSRLTLKFNLLLTPSPSLNPITTPSLQSTFKNSRIFGKMIVVYQPKPLVLPGH